MKVHLLISFYGFQVNLHLPISFSGLQVKVHLPLSFYGFQVKVHLPLSFYGFQVNLHLPLSFYGFQVKVHLLISIFGYTGYIPEYDFFSHIHNHNQSTNLTNHIHQLPTWLSLLQCPISGHSKSHFTSSLVQMRSIPKTCL